MYFSNEILLFIILISHINSEDSENATNKPYCSLNKLCSDCIPCDNYSICSFSNIFCYQNISNNYNKNDDLQTNLSLYYKSDNDMKKFCNSREISLDFMESSLEIFEYISNKNNYLSNKSYHCNYYVKNRYYMNHDIDKAKINFKIINDNDNGFNNGISKINFFLIFLYKIKEDWRFFNLNDTQIRNSPLTKPLNEISEFEILLDFFPDSTSNSNNESFIISIITENPSKSLQKIYIALIIIFIIFLVIIIGLAVLYFYVRSRLRKEQERKIKEEQEKIEKKKKMLDDFLNNELKSKIFDKKLNFINCDSCSICCDNFIIGQSEVSITPCGHIFHHECIEKWFKEKINNPYCPNCNYKFLEYMENPIRIEIKKKKDLNINELKVSNEKEEKFSKISLDNEEIRKNNTEDIPSEQLRLKIFKSDKFKEKENEININDDSIHLSIELENKKRNSINIIEEKTQ